MLRLTALCLAACHVSTGPFRCDDNPDCVGAGSGHRCEATGYCSFIDGACPTGRRYGAYAPEALANSCLAETTAPLVPEGMFYRAYDSGADGAHPDKSWPATVSAFRLDSYEISVGRFRQFVKASMGTQQDPPPPGSGARTLNGMGAQGGWDMSWNTKLAIDTATLIDNLHCDPTLATWTDRDEASEGLPINCITWFEAFAFCAWDGGFLPTETEWSYAAAGGEEQRAFPWSSPASSIAIDCSNANYNNCLGKVSSVGSHSPEGDGRWGHADLGGNVWEWTLDRDAPLVTPCDDCANLVVDPNDPRATRSGDFTFEAPFARVGFRGHDDPSLHSPKHGARCARSP